MPCKNDAAQSMVRLLMELPLQYADACDQARLKDRVEISCIRMLTFLDVDDPSLLKDWVDNLLNV
jgi:hypothetical protein